MPAFGVQLETHYRSGRIVRRFVPIGKILKPVLNECVTPVTCYWCLAFIVRDEADLMLVFQFDLLTDGASPYEGWEMEQSSCSSIIPAFSEWSGHWKLYFAHVECLLTGAIRAWPGQTLFLPGYQALECAWVT
ncbi:hypothetical protein ACLOJK_018419 [Asimina triloba]